MRFLFALLFIAFPFSFSTAKAATPPTECDNIPGIKWEYCTYVPKRSKNVDHVLYYLHAAGEWKRNWEYYQELLAPSFGHDFPTVVSISFGYTWLLNERNSSNESGLLSTFVNEVMPTVENRVLKRVPTQRLLMGVSMGGFNATALVMKHPELFARAALLCPGYISFNPYDEASVVQGYLKRTGANADAVNELISLIQSYFPTRASWDAEAPLLAGSVLLSEKTPPLFLGIARDDPYGFHEGASKFAEIAKLRGASVQFSERMTEHCRNVDFAEVGNFLEPKH